MSVDRLVTYARLQHRSSRKYSVSLHHVARMADGREVLLLDDRGFSSLRSFYADSQDALSQHTTREDLESTARMCVGPDEPPPGTTWEEAVRAHNTWLAGVLRAAGAEISVEDVGRLPHEVVLDDALREATEPR